MAVAMVQFLKEKFETALKEEEDSSTVLFRALFQEIMEDLNMKMRSSVPPGTIDRLRDSLYDLNDILIECQGLSKKHTNLMQRKHMSLSTLKKNLWFRYKTKKRLQVIKHNIQTISIATVEQSSSSGLLSGELGRSNTMEFDRWTSRYVDKAKVHGLNDQLSGVERMLFEEDTGELKGIGIVGMGGVGKTVLAQMIFNSQQVRRRFFPRLWVCMSQTVGKGRDVRREILERILMSLGVEEEDSPSSNGLEELVFTLHAQLMGKRYLIVFDDVWNVEKWYESLYWSLPRGNDWASRLGFALPKGSGGSVIVTSRLEEAAVKMVGTQNLYRIEPNIDEDSCWNIFMDSLTREGGAGDHAILRSMKREIVDKCGGLPLAAKTIGEILCGSLPSADDSEHENKLDP